MSRIITQLVCIISTVSIMDYNIHEASIYIDVHALVLRCKRALNKCDMVCVYL